MNKITLKALKGSIKKWELIVAGKGADEGYRNCPLCVEFYEQDCKGCPVSESSGEICCEMTPYEEWTDAHHPPYKSLIADTKERKSLARKELKFLKSLLP